MQEYKYFDKYHIIKFTICTWEPYPCTPQAAQGDHELLSSEQGSEAILHCLKVEQLLLILIHLQILNHISSSFSPVNLVHECQEVTCLIVLQLRDDPPPLPESQIAGK